MKKRWILVVLILVCSLYIVLNYKKSVVSISKPASGLILKNRITSEQKDLNKSDISSPVEFDESKLFTADSEKTLAKMGLQDFVLYARSLTRFIPSVLIDVKDPICELYAIMEKEKPSSVVDLIKLDHILLDNGIDIANHKSLLYANPAFNNKWEDLEAVEAVGNVTQQSELLALTSNHWLIQYYKALSLGGLLVGIKDNKFLDRPKALEMLNALEAADLNNSSYSYFSIALKDEMQLDFSEDIVKFVTKSGFYTPESFAEKVLFRQGYQSFIHFERAIVTYSRYIIPDYPSTYRVFKKITPGLSGSLQQSLEKKYLNLQSMAEQANDNSSSMIFTVARFSLMNLKHISSDQLKSYRDVRKYPYDLNEVISAYEKMGKEGCDSKKLIDFFNLDVQYGLYK